MYYLSKTTLDGYDLADFVYNFYHNPKAEMSGTIEDMVMFCADVKRKIQRKEMSFSYGYKEVCRMMGGLLGEVLQEKLDFEERQFFRELLDYIPAESEGDTQQGSN